MRKKLGGLLFLNHSVYNELLTYLHRTSFLQQIH